MSKSYLKNKPMEILLFLSTFCMSLNINLGQGIEQKAIAYERHEFVFISGLSNFANMSQQEADATCKYNFRDLREQGIFDERVEKMTWHIWAHLNNQECVMNIRTQPSSSRSSYWTPSNNRNKSFRIQIPIFHDRDVDSIRAF
ncbi:hypothetical protein ACE1CI_33420 [Aerosakkonemataceae cyanobacterium BLCC-F50]|uniref:Uncharacterized protein n=2 Tax=Floridanema TaxID=3396149 RepID=A0ABV4Y1G9_9CYAN